MITLTQHLMTSSDEFALFGLNFQEGRLSESSLPSDARSLLIAETRSRSPRHCAWQQLRRESGRSPPSGLYHSGGWVRVLFDPMPKCVERELYDGTAIGAPSTLLQRYKHTLILLISDSHTEDITHLSLG